MLIANTLIAAFDQLRISCCIHLIFEIKINTKHCRYYIKPVTDNCDYFNPISNPKVFSKNIKIVS